MINKFIEIFLIVVLVFIFSFDNSKADQKRDSVLYQKNFKNDHIYDLLKVNGWNYLVKRLIEKGIPKEYIVFIFQNKEMPHFTNIPFKLVPRESSASYKGFNTSQSAKKVGEYLKLNKLIFDGMERRYNVDPRIVGSLLYVESSFGKNTGQQKAVYRLSRLAGLADPKNIEWNYKMLLKKERKTKYEEVIRRAKYLEDTFLPELVSLINYSIKRRISVFSLKGSFAGAIGIPQFLPTSIERFGVDGNRDGYVDLFNHADAIYSVGNYLKLVGWNNKLSYNGKISRIKVYNNSDPYAKAIIGLSERLN